MPKEVYYIDRKVAENRDFVEFEMVSSLDLANARAPRRLVMQNLCQWKYAAKNAGTQETLTLRLLAHSSSKLLQQVTPTAAVEMCLLLEPRYLMVSH